MNTGFNKATERSHGWALSCQTKTGLPFARAEILDKNIATIWQWTLRPVRGRLLKRHYIGGRVNIFREDLETFLAAPAASKDTATVPATEKAAARARAEAVEAELARAGIVNGPRARQTYETQPVEGCGRTEPTKP